jgi:sugar (pentulose or hexulose) kinase
MTAKPIENVAVIDIGKTHAKIIILNAATGAETTSRKIVNSVLKDAPYPHYDIDSLWAFILHTLAEFTKDPGYQAISITTHGASAVLLDEEGDLALPVLDYEHTYPQSIRDAYAALRPPFEETFSPALSAGLNLGAQLHYQKTTFPSEFARVATVLTYPQYWAYLLTGVKASEVTSLGCHTDLWRPAANTFSSLPETLGIADTFPPIRSAFDALGPVLPEIAEKIGLPHPVPVYCGLHDSNASLLPHLIARKSPFSVVSTGTWIVSFGVGGTMDKLDPSRDTLVNVDAYGDPVPSARFMGGREFERLTAGRNTPTQAECVDAILRVLADQILLLPSVVEGSGPYPDRQGGWITEPRDEAERYVAASFYAAMMTATCLGLIGQSGTIIVEGPFSANENYTQALASITGAEVFVTNANSPSGTALGAALLAVKKAPQQSYRLIKPRHDMSHYHQTWLDSLGKTKALT